MATEFQFDIFLSHNTADKPWVRDLFHLLQGQNFKVFFDEESIDFGADIAMSLDKALQGSKHILLVITPKSMASKWVALETSVGIYANPNAAERKLIPLLLERTPWRQIPATIRRLNAVDLTDSSNRTVRLRKLLNQLGIPDADTLELPDWPSVEGHALTPTRVPKGHFLTKPSKVKLNKVRNPAALAPNPPLRLSPIATDVSTVLSRIDQLGVIDVFQPPVTSNLLCATLNRSAAIKANSYVEAAFKDLNLRLKAAGRLELHKSVRYRIIAPLRRLERNRRVEYIMDIGEMDFECFALLAEKAVDPTVKKYVEKQIGAIATRLPDSYQKCPPPLNPMNKGLLGVQMVLITSDGYTLLRRRGKHVTEAPYTWDVSFSGYSGTTIFNGGNFDLGQTVQGELAEEIRDMSGEPGEIRFTALHFSRTSGTTVMLGFWQVDVTSAELVSYLKRTGKRAIELANRSRLFKTSIPPREQYVKDYWNLVVPFDGPTIANALREGERIAKRAENMAGDSRVIVQASRASLILALQAHGKSTDDLLT